jgi:ATP-binding cassette subfamily F protein 3
MLQINNLSYSIGERKLLDQISLNISPGQRIALVGANGTGKTTFLRLIMGELEMESGSINKPNDYEIGYLPQEELNPEETAILEYTLLGSKRIMNIEEEIISLHHQLSDSPKDEKKLLERLGTLETEFSLRGGYEIEYKAKKILMGLGFKVGDFDRTLNEFSGGWRMRVLLARILLMEPPILLLDEPTNHLDIESLEWLEDYLRNYPGGIVVVSHDRFFIDRMAKEIVELYNGKAKKYTGNYSSYQRQKEEQRTILIEQYKRQQDEIQKVKQFIERFRYKATKAKQVQSRIKQLEKIELISPPEEKSNISFKIEVSSQSYKDVLTVKDLSFSYDTVNVLKNLDLYISRGDKIALVGENGAGKTTFTKLISNELNAASGELTIGEKVILGYYAQHQIDALNMDGTIYQEVESAASPLYRTKLRDILGVFRFSGNDVEKQIKVLSGGEKARVSLAKILLSPCNFLIMDEPTNHLDLASKQALEKALNDYNGTMILISHDRYFLDKLVNRVIEIKDGTLKEYIGNYSEYLAKKEENKELDSSEKITIKESTEEKPQGTRKSKEQKRKEAQARQAISKERSVLQKRIEFIEQELEKIEAQKVEKETKMAEPETYSQPELIKKIKKEYDTLDLRIEEYESEWEELQIKYEDLLQQLNSIEV